MYCLVGDTVVCYTKRNRDTMAGVTPGLWYLRSRQIPSIVALCTTITCRFRENVLLLLCVSMRNCLNILIHIINV